MTDNSRQNRPRAAALPSTRAWVVVHLLLPLLPFLMGALVRFLSCLAVSWAAFDASELALSLCFISVFVRQSLLESEILLANRDKEDEVAESATLCLGATLIFFTLFGVVEAFSILVNDRQVRELRSPLAAFQILVFMLGPPSLLLFAGIQKSFKLRARAR